MEAEAEEAWGSFIGDLFLPDLLEENFEISEVVVSEWVTAEEEGSWGFSVGLADLVASF